jgi:hypothetical protein
MARAIRILSPHCGNPPFCRVCLLGVERCQTAYSASYYLDCTVIRACDSGILPCCQAVGILIWYITLYNQVLRHYTIFASSATYATLAVMGAVAAFASSYAIPRIPAHYILAIGSISSCVACILVATTPAQQIYWAPIFPALIFTAFGPDFIFTATQIIASNTVRRDQQGIAGSLMATVLSYSLSTGVGISGQLKLIPTMADARFSKDIVVLCTLVLGYPA